jgi:predicted metal-dependent HD superfamily phosphohydrolase
MEEKKNMKKQHMYIYATEKGREIWEMQARENLKREISMLRQGLIPLENN